MRETPKFDRAQRDQADLRAGLWEHRLPGAKYVLVDVDGTLACAAPHRSVYDEKKCHLDSLYTVVAEWVRALYPEYNVVIFSGRHDTWGDVTAAWLDTKNVPFDYMLMRKEKDNRPDDVVKQELLDLLLTFVPKDQIAFVLDDRPKVVRMWRRNGITVYPVRGAIEEF